MLWEKPPNRQLIHHVEIQPYNATIFLLLGTILPYINHLLHRIIWHIVITVYAHTQLCFNCCIGCIVTRVESPIRFINIFNCELRSFYHKMIFIFSIKFSSHPIKSLSLSHNFLTQTFHPSSRTICTTVIDNQPLKVFGSLTA